MNSPSQNFAWLFDRNLFMIFISQFLKPIQVPTIHHYQFLYQVLQEIIRIPHQLLSLHEHQYSRKHS